MRAFLSVALTTFLVLQGCNPKQWMRDASAANGSTAQNEHNESTLRLINQSAEAIVGIYLQPSDSEQHPPNLLHKEALGKDASFFVEGIRAGHWDILLVDERGFQKRIPGQHFDGSKSYYLLIDGYSWTAP